MFRTAPIRAALQRSHKPLVSIGRPSSVIFLAAGKDASYERRQHVPRIEAGAHQFARIVLGVAALEVAGTTHLDAIIGRRTPLFLDAAGRAVNIGGSTGMSRLNNEPNLNGTGAPRYPW